ncbi:two-component system response regulator [Bowmanella dokdonensis]|uniref:EAL domain-containing protein n=1 Tax=Bowmanella dokdonensis TaxID=751969 RepID=A0A939DMQ8_9ALTE|nr:EAL domain-containing protein [Bowmanella dokdonensis]MBN7824621.1 EAL domain-containing protein [Bowmanella dokdonensis]
MAVPTNLNHVLLIARDDAQRQSIAALLQSRAPVTLCQAGSSADALALLKEQSFDLLISEVEVEPLDGWRLSRMLRAGLFRSAADTPFILLTATHCERIAETTARAYGIDEVLPIEQFERLPELAGRVVSNGPWEKKLSVLVVEDTPDTAELISRVLQPKYRVQIAADGAQGVEMFARGDYAVVLLDVMLPGLSGQQVLAEILKLRPSQTVVVMTAHGGLEIAESMMGQGAVDFISKPFRVEQLRHVMEVAIQREDFMVSNAQFADKVRALNSRNAQYQALSDTHQRVLSHLSTVIMELDNEGKIRFLNPAWEVLTGYARDTSMGEPFLSFVDNSFAREAGQVEEMLRSLYRGETSYQSCEFKLRHARFNSRWVGAKFNTLLDASGKQTVTLTLDNIDERKQAEQQLQHLALHDTLTDLYNRHFFDQQLNLLTESARRHQDSHALLYIDLDHFKVINDTHGHQQGDAVLKEVARRLTQCKRSSDILCRIGGDEFALLLLHTSRQDARIMAENICDAMCQGHYHFEDRIYVVSCSVGIAEIDGKLSAQTYLQQADIALYVAKRRGRNLAHLYDEQDQDSSDFKASIRWVQTLNEAIVNDRMLLHFQPVVRCQSREVVYFEALVRLLIEDKLVYPGDFIPALERAEDINLLDHQVISKAICMMSRYPLLQKVAINLSAQAFDDARLLPLVEEKLKQYGVAPNRIIFELTESASLSNLDASRQMMQQLKQLGCEFSIDDFGTGFSTFSYLKRIPADSIKIDGSFVREMHLNPIDHALVKSICEVAKVLGKRSVAEFVEDEKTLIELQALGVDYAQGYYICWPMDIEALQAHYGS